MLEPKRQGFLARAAGQAHFEEIKAYYRNLAVWLSPPARIRCMNSRLVLDLVLQRAIPKLIPEIDPWMPEPERLAKGFDGVQWFGASPVLDIALGGALVALREAFPEPSEELAAKLERENLEEVLQKGALEGLERGFKSAMAAANRVRAELKLG